jgi:hypothetical protein
MAPLFSKVLSRYRVGYYNGTLCRSNPQLIVDNRPHVKIATTYSYENLQRAIGIRLN